jgi:hypothetical protein
MSNEENTMHKDFADWMSSVDIGKDRESLTLRWQTVSRLVSDEELNKDGFDELVRFIFGEKLPESTLEWLQTEFKSDDSLFTNDANKNPQELLALAASIIALTIEEGSYYLASHVGVNILMAYCGELRPPAYGDYLIAKAQNAVKENAIRIRERNTPTKIATNKWDETIDDLAETNPPEAIKVLAPIVKKNDIVLKNANLTIRALENHIAIKDEELEILWWVIVGYSDMLNTPLGNIHEVLQPFVYGTELSNHISLGIEPPALRGILSKCLANPEQKILFKTLGEHVGEFAPMMLDSISSEPCSVLTPIHYLVKCILDIGEHWQDKWSRDTKLTPDMEMTSIDLAVQFCRERIQLTNSES